MSLCNGKITYTKFIGSSTAGRSNKPPVVYCVPSYYVNYSKKIEINFMIKEKLREWKT